MLNLLAILSAKYLVYILVALSIIYFATCKHNVKKIIVFVILILSTSFIAAKILSNFFYDPRPFVTGNFTPLISHAANNGFPSDHALLSFSLASIIFIFNKKWGITFFVIGTIIGASRVYAGIHWPIDIAGSFLISVIVSIFYYLILKRFNKLI